MKARRWSFIRAILALLLIALAVLVAASFRNSGSAPVTIVDARRLSNSGRVALDIRNDAPGRVRLFAVDLLARAGTNWVYVGHVPLGYTNSTDRSMSIEVNFPEWRGPWKAKLVYMPAFSRFKLLRYQLLEVWKTHSISLGLGMTGWEGERHAYSPEIAE